MAEDPLRDCLYQLYYSVIRTTGAHRAQRIMREVAEGRMTPEDAVKEAKRLKITTF